MSNAPLLSAVCALLVLAGATPAARAAPGDVVVPAHRTRDGIWVPANVPPSSGGTYLARRPHKRSAAHGTSRAAGAAMTVPIFADARAMKR